MEIALVFAGAALLYFGGELLVKGAVNLSRIYGLSPLVIGLTVVAFGTSTPELASSLMAASRGSGDIAIGNVIGSNIANIGLILGTTAVIYPIAARARFLTREMPILLGVSALIPLILVGNQISRIEGLGLCVLITPYLWILMAKGEAPEITAEFTKEYGERPPSVVVPLLRIAAGLALLVAGAGALIEGAVTIARALGVSDRVIGITLVAFGTSLPELATSLVAAYRKEGDIALGNVIGSNVFNVLTVLGVTAAFLPLRIDAQSMWKDVFVMLVFSIVLIPFAINRRRIDRWEGALLFVAYGVYVANLFVQG